MLRPRVFCTLLLVLALVGVPALAGSNPDAAALHKGFGDYPLRTLAPIAAACGFLALGAMALLRREPDPPASPREPERAPTPRAALSA